MITTTMSSNNNFMIGSRVLTGLGFIKKGEIRFIGETKFAPGEWIGIHLDTPDGKNNGTVNEIKYFDTEPMHGLFVKRVQVKLDTAISPAATSSVLSPSNKSINANKNSAASAKDKLNELKDRRSSLTNKANASVSNLPTMKGTRTSIIPVAPSTKSSLSSSGQGQGEYVANTTSKDINVVDHINQSNSVTNDIKSNNNTEIIHSLYIASNNNHLPSTVVDTSINVSVCNFPHTPTMKVTAHLTDSQPVSLPYDRSSTSTTINTVTMNTAATATKSVPIVASTHLHSNNNIAQEEGREHTPTQRIETTQKEELPQEDNLVVVDNRDSSSSSSSNSRSAYAANDVIHLNSKNNFTGDETIEVENVASHLEVAAVTNLVDNTKITNNNDDDVAVVGKDSTSKHTFTEDILPSKSDHINQEDITTTITATSAATMLSTKDYAIEELKDSSSENVTGEMLLNPQPHIPSETTAISKDAKLIEYLQASVMKLTIDNEYYQELIKHERNENEKYVKEKNDLDSLAEHLNEQLEKLQSEKINDINTLKTKHIQDINQLRKDYMKENSELKSKIFALENAPPKPVVAVPVVCETELMKMKMEYEDQIHELMSGIEKLTLEKEQCALELELLEEKYLQAQIDLEEVLATQSNDSVREPHIDKLPSDSVSSNHINDKAEVEKYKEALRLLSNTSVQDKLLLAKLESRLVHLEKENLSLQACKTQSEEDLFILRQTVDSVSSYEEMIEKLSSENIEAMEKINEYEQTISDLEDAQELNDEIDAAQRSQIDQHLVTIATLEVSKLDYEQKIVVKDQQFKESIQAIDKLKQTNITLRHEVNRLSQLLSLESSETKQLEQKLKELASLRTQVELQGKELSTLYSDHMNVTMMKYKYQVLYHRMDALFGGTSFFLEESKQVNIEIVLVSTTTTGLEACRLLNNALTAVLLSEESMQFLNAMYVGEPQSSSSSIPYSLKCVSTLGQLYFLLLQTQAYCIQCTIDFFTLCNQNSSDFYKHTSIISQKMIDFKQIFEQIISLSIQFHNMYDELLLEYNNQQLNTGLFEDNEADNTITPLLQFNTSDDIDTTSTPANILKTTRKSPLKYHYTNTITTTVMGKNLHDIVMALGDLTSTLSKHMQIDVVADEGDVDVPTILQNLPLIMATKVVHNSDSKSDLVAATVKSTLVVLKLEFLLVLLDTLVSISLYQINEKKTNSQQLPSTITISSLVAMMDTLKSIKTDIRYIITHLKQPNMSQMSKYLPDIIGHFQLLLSCFHFNKINNHQAMNHYMVFNFKNTTNSVSIFKLLQSFIRKINSDLFSESMDKLATVCGGMIYFPTLLFVNTNSMREQFQSLVDRYWMLLISPHSNNSMELLQCDATFTNSTEPSQLHISHLNDDVIQIPWKQRVHDVRNVVTLKLVNTNNTEESSALSSNAATSISKSISMDNSLVFAQNHKNVLNELELKRDELQYAIRKCSELQEKVEHYEQLLQETNINNTQNMNTTNLKKNTSMVSVTNSTDEVVDHNIQDLVIEIKTLEDALHTTETRADALEQETKLLKAQLTMQGLILKSNNNNEMNKNKSNINSASSSSNSNKIQTFQQSSSNKFQYSFQLYQLIIDENNYWKSLVLKRFTSYLKPLQINKTNVNYVKNIFNKAVLDFHDILISLQANKKNDHLRIKLNTNESFNNNYYNNNVRSSLYYKLRLIRAKNIQLKVINLTETCKVSSQASLNRDLKYHK